jgi:hypothetical protein
VSVLDFPHVVDVHVQVNSRDKYGGTTRYPVAVYTSEPAWVQPASAKDATEYERRGMDVSHVIYFRRDLGLTTEHTIDHGGKIYEVQGFQDASAGLSVIWKATVLHRTDGAK